MPRTNYKGIPIGAVDGLHEGALELLEGRLAPGSSVLDLGTGAGAFMERLTDAGFSVVGVDLEEQSFRGSSPFVRQDLNQPFQSGLADRGRFDAVAAIEVAEHLENPRHLFRECRKLLRPDGYLLVTTPYVESVYSRTKFLVTGRFEWFEDGHYRSSGHITPLTQWQLRQIADETGFAVAETRPGPPSEVSWKRKLAAIPLALLMRHAGRDTIRLTLFKVAGG